MINSLCQAPHFVSPSIVTKHMVNMKSINFRNSKVIQNLENIHMKNLYQEQCIQKLTFLTFWYLCLFSAINFSLIYKIGDGQLTSQQKQCGGESWNILSRRKSKLAVHQHLPGQEDQVALMVAELLKQQDQPSHVAAKWITLSCKVKKRTKLHTDTLWHKNKKSRKE